MDAFLTYLYAKSTRMFLEAQTDKSLKSKIGINIASFILTSVLVVYLIGLHLIKIFFQIIYMRQQDVAGKDENID